MVDQSLIVETGLEALANLIAHVDALQKLRPSETLTAGPPYAIISNGEIPQRVEAICNLQALAYGCLFDGGPRSGESPKQNKLRISRVQSIKDQCKGFNFSQMRNRGVRNALSHFDDRMLKSLMIGGEFSIIKDITVSHVAAFNFETRVIYIRYYCFDIDTLFLFDEKLKFLELRNEAEQALGMIK